MSDRTKGKQDSNLASKDESEPFRLNLPGFILDEEAGLGDVLKRGTRRVGIRPCGGCERRAARLNRWLVFTPRRS